MSGKTERLSSRPSELWYRIRAKGGIGQMDELGIFLAIAAINIPRRPISSGKFLVPRGKMRISRPSQEISAVSLPIY